MASAGRVVLRPIARRVCVSAVALALASGCTGATGVHAPDGPRTLDAAAVARCAALVGRTYEGARVTGVKAVAVGEAGGKDLFGSTRAPVPFCRVRATGSSGPGSIITIEVLLPARWNGKMVGVGGGGLSGGLSGSTGGLMRELARGYAGVASDAGHTDARDASWAIDRPVSVEDFGHRANHVAAVVARAVIADHYARPVEKSFFMGCSNGGRDALMLAQRYPADYDGIIAGAPALNWTGLMTAFQAHHQRFRSSPAARALPGKLAMLRAAVMRRCDALDGVRDNVLENPLACDFDPAEIQCAPGRAPRQCLTQDEVSLVRAIYGGVRAPDGEPVLAGYPKGSEHGRAIIPLLGWGPWFLNGLKAGVRLSTEYFRGIVTGDLHWSADNFEIGRDHALARSGTAAALDAVDPELAAFVSRGGRLLMFHGWEDAAIPAGETVAYHEAVQARTEGAPEAVRLFMAPGMAHCSLGHGPDTLDLIPVIDRWVSEGQAPDRIVAVKLDDGLLRWLGRAPRTVRTRPLCPWPQTARYLGSGSTDHEENFVCVAPAPTAEPFALPPPETPVPSET